MPKTCDGCGLVYDVDIYGDPGEVGDHCPGCGAEQ